MLFLETERLREPEIRDLWRKWEREGENALRHVGAFPLPEKGHMPVGSVTVPAAWWPGGTNPVRARK